MPQKVVIDARESGTGTGTYIDKLIEYMHRLKPAYEIVVLTKKHRVDFIKTVAPGFTVVESNFKEFTFAEQIGFLRQLNSLDADLVHFGMTQQPVMYRGKSVATIHDLTTARFYNPVKNWLFFKFKQNIYKFVIKRVARKSVRIIVPSQLVKEDVAQFTKIQPEKIVVIYEAADKITVAPQPVQSLENNQFIMYVGRAQPHKNLNRLVDALAIIHKTHPNLHLALVGKADANHQLLQKYVKSRKINNIIFTGHVTYGQLRWLYENTAAYVFPSLSEGFGLPALEAMVHGAPVVSSNATCLPEIYSDAALYFNPKDIENMAEKINMVLNDTKNASQLRNKAKDQAAKYSWQRTAEQTFKVYKEVLEN